METHYEKYKETIKKVARRNYNKRVAWINKFLSDKSCVYCGESETICLKFYPHDSDIKKKSKTVSGKEEAEELISNSKVICQNCWIKVDNDLIELI